MDTSDGNFAITSPVSGSITVQEPNSNTYWWWWNNRYPISWTYSGSPGSMVTILLFKGSTQVATIATVPIGNAGWGSYEWTVPAGIGEGTDFSVHIQSTSQPSIMGASDNIWISHQWRDDAVSLDYQNINSLRQGNWHECPRSFRDTLYVLYSICVEWQRNRNCRILRYPE